MTQTPRAVANSQAKLADPVPLGFDNVELLVIVVDETKAAELPMALKFLALVREL